MRVIELEVPESENGAAARNFLRSKGISRRVLTDLKFGGGLTRGGEILKNCDRVFAGDRLKIILPDEENLIEPNASLAVKTVYEDEDFAVFDKPAGMPVHPSLSHHGDTLGNYFSYLYPKTAFRALGRLDKNTSGLVLCAKNTVAAAAEYEKTYYAAVGGIIEDPGKIELNIGRKDGSIIEHEVRADGKPAVTLFRPIFSENGRTLLEIKLKTGRTHQIRVHFSHIGFPLLGDELYGGDMSEIARHALHCGVLEVFFPFDGRIFRVKSPIPSDIAALFPNFHDSEMKSVQNSQNKTV